MTNNLKHIYWFAPYNLEGPSTRYRGYYPIRLLNKEYNISCDFVYPSNKISIIWKFLKIFFTTLLFRKKNSIIVIQKVCSNRIYANLLKLLVLLQPENTVYDIDDAEYLRNDVKTLHFFLKKCKAISVGSSALMEYCNRFNVNVFVLTSPVLTHNEQKKERNNVPNIGWVGDFGNGQQISIDFAHKTSMFNVLFPQIKKINRAISLTLIGVKNKSDIPEIIDYFKFNPNIKLNILEALNWEKDEWVYCEIKKFDIGVSPLTNHLFNESKSAFKAKQYLSVGIPTIASNVGENNKFVKDNHNGFLCENSRDFEKSINKIIDMSDSEYFELSNNALKGREDFSMKQYCESLINLYYNSNQVNVALDQKKVKTH